MRIKCLAKVVGSQLLPVDKLESCVTTAMVALLESKSVLGLEPRPPKRWLLAEPSAVITATHMRELSLHAL